MIIQSNKKRARIILMTGDITGLSRRSVKRRARKIRKTYTGKDFINIKHCEFH